MYHRIALGLGISLLSAAAFTPHRAAAAAAETEQPLEEAVVTGTRFADRTVTTSPVPIDALGGNEIRASGYQETSEILRQLAPSFAFATPTTPDGNTHIHSASLRGLSPDATLVLVNGKRLHSAAWINTGGTIGKGSAPTDFNQVPGSAIGRIEILRDGASAQWLRRHRRRDQHPAARGHRPARQRQRRHHLRRRRRHL